jgi:hypothetical protein
MATYTERLFVAPGALATHGFSAYNTVDIFGLLTYGLEWLRTSIWAKQDAFITTSWTKLDFVGTTTWTNIDF